jgi:hypothetical protein
LNNSYRYLNDDVYKDDAYLALSSQFTNRQVLESFYSSLIDDETKDNFLRVCTSYLFFVKNGDWYVRVPRSNSLIEYFTNSFKLVALIGIIESLSEKKNVDFFFWLSEKAKVQGDLFPIQDKLQLEGLHDAYKHEHGSIRRCKSFFTNLPLATKEQLCKSITIDGVPIQSIEKVVEKIYKIRSAFAHNIDTNLEINSSMCITREGNKRVIWELPMQLLQKSFEEGVIAHFSKCSRYSTS